MYVMEELFKQKKAENSEQFNLRIHRGLSWFRKAGECDEDLDFNFLSLWVSFSALYAQKIDLTKQRMVFSAFFQQIIHADYENKLHFLIWEKYGHIIKSLLNNPYIYQGYWDFKNKNINPETWKHDFDQERGWVQHALETKDILVVLNSVFERLHTLFQQVSQGGTTYNSGLNRSQLQQSCIILNAFIPVFIQILLENSQQLDQKKPFYPMIQMS